MARNDHGNKNTYGHTRSGGRAPLGSGGRFQALSAKLAAEPGVRNPNALAASIGRKKYGNAAMSRMAQKGKQQNDADGDE